MQKNLSKTTMWILTVFLFVLICGCVKTENPTSDFIEVETNQENKDNIAHVISADLIKGISPIRAVEMCQHYIGEMDNDNFVFKLAEVHTGRKISYSFENAVELNDEKFCVVRMQWTGDNDTTWSTIGFVAIPEVGDKIYEAELVKEGVYAVNNVIIYID